MQEILDYANKKLIKKYDRYYIRFIGGQYVELPCDILIEEAEAKNITENPILIEHIFAEYKKKIKWTMNDFIKTGLKEYIIFTCEYSEEDTVSLINRLDKYEDIKYEMYEHGMSGKFPIYGAVKVMNKTAEMLCDEKQISSCEAYIMLLEMREKDK